MFLATSNSKSFWVEEAPKYCDGLCEGTSTRLCHRPPTSQQHVNQGPLTTISYISPTVQSQIELVNNPQVIAERQRMQIIELESDLTWSDMCTIGVADRICKDDTNRPTRPTADCDLYNLLNDSDCD